MNNLKLILMDAIATRVKDEYPTAKAACEVHGFTPFQLSACSKGKEDRLSMDRLCEMVDELGGELNIEVKYVRHR